MSADSDPGAPARRRAAYRLLGLGCAAVALAMVAVAGVDYVTALDEPGGLPTRSWLFVAAVPFLVLGGIGVRLGFADRLGSPASAPARSLELRVVPYAHPDVRALVADLQAEYVVRYGGTDATPMDHRQFEPPHGLFVVGYVAREPAAMGGWRFRPDVSVLAGERAAEVKRMYVAPWARRAGLARAVLARLEGTARDAGADVMVLETGLPQPEAVALYRSAGYTDVARFGFYADRPHTVYLGKRL